MSITTDENLKIRHLMAAIESMEGVNIPASTEIRIVNVYQELKALLGRETVVE
jgi:hypothetical protein